MTGNAQCRRLPARSILWAALVLALPAQAPAQRLAIVSTGVHQYDGGPPTPSDFYFAPLDTVFVTMRVAGFTTKKKENDDEYFQLHYEVQAFDPAGLPLAEKTEDDQVADLTAEDKKNKWMPLVPYQVTVPPAAPSGAYKIVVRVRDELNQATATQEIEIPVRGRAVEPSDTIVVRNFRFLRSELDPQPLAVGAYRAGDTLWARFDITGYQFAEKNHFHINYGITVLRGSGSVLFTQEVAADEERPEAFYPERHIMAGLSLNLTPDLAKDEYTIVLTLRDLISGQSSESRQIFHVD